MRLLIVIVGFLMVHSSAAIAQEKKLIESSVSGTTSLGRLHKHAGVSINYEGSQELTMALRSRLAEKGWKIVEDPAGATARIRIVPVYSGKASERPLMINETPETTSLSIFDVASAILSAGQLATSLPQAVSTGGTSHLVSNALATSATANLIQTAEKSGAFKRTKKPQEAFLVSIAIDAKDGNHQAGQVLSESYAEGVPVGLLVKDNFDLVVWFLE